MKIAVIGDIHGNKDALKCVLDDIKQNNVDHIIATGDLVGYLPYPNEVIELLRQARVLVIQGNHDQRIGEEQPVTEDDIKQLIGVDLTRQASNLYTNKVITAENRQYLRNLPQKLRLEVGNKSILFVHGSPRRIDEYVYEDEALLSEIAETFTEDILVCGHTHTPYSLRKNGKHFINVGSVGKPKTTRPEATYVILEVREKCVTTIIREVAYDLAPLIQAIKANPMIANGLIKNLTEGC